MGGDPSAFMIVQRGAGANLSVDVTMPTGGWAKVQGDSIVNQGLDTVPVHASTLNEAITTANGSNPRIDSVILEALDNVHDASGLNQARVRVLTGTATSGATLINRTGAAALPGNARLLADVLVPASDTTITNDQIRDRRKWALGAFTRIVRTAGSLTSASGSMVQLSSTLQARVECSGAPMRLLLHGQLQHSTANSYIAFQPTIDGAGIDSVSDYGPTTVNTAGGAVAYPPDPEYVFTPAAGSHLLEWFWRTGVATATLLAVAGSPAMVIIAEVIRLNAANNTVTTG